MDTKTKEYIKKGILLLIIIGVIVAVKVFDLDDYLTFENLKKYKEQLSVFIESNYLLAVVAFIGVYVVVTAFSIPGAAVLSLACGFLFGMWGVLYVNAGATTGAILAFLAARYLLGDSIQEKYSEKLAKFNGDLKKNGPNYFLTLRFIPIFPFFLINLLGGLTNIPLRTFAWTTAVGIIPGSFVYVYAGTQLGTINSMGDIMTWQMILVFVFFGILAIVPVVWKKIQAKKPPPEGA
ncbi:MAG: TVP38/TMEM64 family protein [bacterium]|nr:TVP38/TMEM64 family protein [bacterium]